MFKLSILITTMDDRIDHVISNMVPKYSNCEIVISHQITHENIQPKLKSDFPNNCVYVYMYDKGLSKNRNNAIKYATGDICVLCDDDLLHLENFDKIIIKAFEENDQFDIMTFNAIDSKNRLINPLPQLKFRHNSISILRICSMMIAFKNYSIKINNIMFDEKFGLGAQYGISEENIFLKDCINKGLLLMHYPENIVKHSDISSGVIWNTNMIKLRRHVFYRMYGKIYGNILYCIFIIIKLPNIIISKIKN